MLVKIYSIFFKSRKRYFLSNSCNKCGPSTWVSGAWYYHVIFQVLRGAERQTAQQEPRQTSFQTIQRGMKKTDLAHMTREPQGLQEFYWCPKQWIQMLWLTGQSVGSQGLQLRKLRQFIGLCSTHEAPGGGLLKRSWLNLCLMGHSFLCPCQSHAQLLGGSQKSWPLVPSSSTKASQPSWGPPCATDPPS